VTLYPLRSGVVQGVSGKNQRPLSMACGLYKMIMTEKARCAVIVYFILLYYNDIESLLKLFRWKGFY